MRFWPFLLLGAGLLPQASLAVGVHQHGVAQLDVVLEPPLLTVALHSPLANLIGFEHQPVTAGEQARWAELQKQIQQADLQLVLPERAACSLQEVALSSPFADHDHDHDHGHHHADLTVEYRFHCNKAAQLNQLQLPLLQNYPGIEKLEVRMLTPAGQHLQHLGGPQNTLSLP